MNSLNQDDMRVIERAAQWCLEDGAPEDQAAFRAWLRGSVRHVEEFLFVSAIFKKFSSFDPQKRIDVDELIAAASSNVVAIDDASSQVRPLSKLEQGETQPGSRDEVPMMAMGRRLTPSRERADLRTHIRTRWYRKAAGMAAILAVLAVCLGWLLLSARSQHFSTAVGELRSFELSDGSTLLLNTQSEVRVQFSDTARDVQLVSGEALFKVARHPARPFRVHSGSAVIQAIGTQFNVYKRAAGTRVSVIEGVVQVSSEQTATTDQAGTKQPISPRLKAGEEVEIAPNGNVKPIASIDTARAVAWQQRRLVFLDEPLAQVVEEFNRYNRTPKMQVSDEVVGADEITGVFDADDPESFIDFLGRDGHLSFERMADRIVISAH